MFPRQLHNIIVEDWKTNNSYQGFFSPILFEAIEYFQQNIITFISWANGVSRGVYDCLIQILARITQQSYVLFQMPLF